MLLAVLLAGMVLVQEAKADNYVSAIYTPKTTEIGIVQLSDFSGAQIKAEAVTTAYGLEIGHTFDAGSINLLYGFGIQYVDCQITEKVTTPYWSFSYEDSVHLLDFYGKLGIETPINGLYVTGKFGGLFYSTQYLGSTKIHGKEHYGGGLLYKIPGDSYGIVASADIDNLMNYTLGLGAYWKF